MHSEHVQQYGANSSSKEPTNLVENFHNHVVAGMYAPQLAGKLSGCRAVGFRDWCFVVKILESGSLTLNPCRM